MKKIIPLLSILFIFSNCSNEDDTQNLIGSENIFIGNVIILNQQELDDFTANNYTKIEGFLKISGVNDLTMLNTLKTVDGDLFIGYSDTTGLYDNPDLESLNGIENIKYVGGEFRIVYNYLIDEVNQLSNLEAVGYKFTIFGNSQLISCTNFEKLMTIGDGGLWIQDNRDLESVDFQELTAMGNLKVVHEFSLSQMNFPNLVTTNDFSIEECFSLANFNGFSSLESVNLFTLYNNDLTNLDGLASLETISGGIRILYCYYLSDYCELNDVNLTGTTYWVDYNSFNPTETQLSSSTECSN